MHDSAFLVVFYLRLVAKYAYASYEATPSEWAFGKLVSSAILSHFRLTETCCCNALANSRFG